MKIAVYIPTASFYVGGGEVVPLLQAEYLKKNSPESEVVVITLAVENETTFFQNFKERNKDIRFIGLDKPERINSFENRTVDHSLTHELYYSLSRSVSQLCCNERFDIVLTHYAPAAISIPSGTKQILFLHGVPSSIDLINNVSVHVADRLLAVSKSVGEGWTQLTGERDITVQHNGIDETQFTPDTVEEDIDVLYVGRLIEIKGVQHLIEAVAKVKKTGLNPGLKVVIGGKGPYESTLKELAHELNVDDLVEFKGFIPDEDLLHYYRRSKVCVFPSYEKEGVLTTMLEAAATGKAIITANCCGMPDFLKHEHNGLLFEGKNSEDLKEKLLVMLSDEALRRKLAAQARQDIYGYWTWNQSALRLLKIIEETV